MAKNTSKSAKPARSAAATQKTTKIKALQQNLYKWNGWLAAVFAVQGIIILVLSASRNLPVMTNYLGVDTLQTQVHGHTILAAGVHHLFDVNLAWIVALFLFLPAIAHGLAATVLRERYEKDLSNGINKIRWIEYAFSTGLMLVAIGLVSGMYDFSSLLMIFAFSAVMNLLGLVMEMRSQGAHKMDWPSCAVGSISGIVPWVVLAIYLFGAHLYGSMSGFVYWIYLTLLVLFVGFAVNTVLQYRKKGKWADYLYGERTFMILSFAAKTALAWQLFAGSLRP